MTIHDWLDSRVPAPPDLLRSRLREALGTERGDPSAACLHAGTAILQKLLDDDAAGRESALDLLTADALVTYAFEAAATDLSSLEQRCGDALRRIAALDDASRGAGA